MNVSHPLESLCKLVNHNFDVQRTPDASNFRQKTLKSAYGVLAVNHGSDDMLYLQLQGLVKGV